MRPGGVERALRVQTPAIRSQAEQQNALTVEQLRGELEAAMETIQQLRQQPDAAEEVAWQAAAAPPAASSEVCATCSGTFHVDRFIRFGYLS